MMDNGMHPEKTIMVACLICIYIYIEMKIVSKKDIYIYIYGSLYCRENSCTIGDLMNLMYISNQLIYLDMIFGKWKMD